MTILWIQGLEHLTSIILLSAIQKHSFTVKAEAQTNGSDLGTLLKCTLFKFYFEFDPSWALWDR